MKIAALLAIVLAWGYHHQSANQPGRGTGATAAPPALPAYSAFAGLSTSTADQTASFTSWYTAGTPGTWSGPAAGAGQLDATFHTTAYRMPTPTDCAPTACGSDKFGTIQVYSKTNPFACDNTMVAFGGEGSWIYLYNLSGSRSTVSATFLRRIQIDPSTNAYAANASDLASDFSNWTWQQDCTQTSKHRMYYTGRTATSGAARVALKRYDADTNTSVIIHDFSSTIASIAGCTDVDNQREGNPDDTDRYWLLMCRNPGASADYAAILYDRTTDTVTTASFLAGGICGASECPKVGSAHANWTGLSPSGNYLLINWNVTASPTTLARGMGTEVFDRSFTFKGWADAGNSHADVGYTADGVEVYVTTPYGQYRYDYNALAITDLSNLSTAVPTGPKWAPGERTVGLPCIYNYDATNCPLTGSLHGQAYTISMRGSHGDQKGAVMLSNFESLSTPQGFGGWGTNQNVFVLLNYATAYATPGDGNPVPVGNFRILGRTHTVHAQSTGGTDQGDYFAQTDATCNWDCTLVAYTSTGEIDNGGPGGTANTTDAQLPTGVPRHQAIITGLPY